MAEDFTRWSQVVRIWHWGKALELLPVLGAQCVQNDGDVVARRAQYEEAQCARRRWLRADAGKEIFRRNRVGLERGSQEGTNLFWKSLRNLWFGVLVFKIDHELQYREQSRRIRLTVVSLQNAREFPNIFKRLLAACIKTFNAHWDGLRDLRPDGDSVSASMVAMPSVASEGTHQFSVDPPIVAMVRAGLLIPPAARA